MMVYEDNYLAHFGIKGMKWGVRRFQNEDGSLTNEGKARYDTGKLKVSIVNGTDKPASERIVQLPQMEMRKNKHKKLSQMTDQELRDSINRMNMEKQYKQLVAEQKGKKGRGNDQGGNQGFRNNHPLLKQLFLDTATTVLTRQIQTKTDEILAPKRMERAKKNGMDNAEMNKYRYFKRSK